MNEDRLAELERKIQYLTDRQEILDCVARHARGCDRFDAEVNASAFHTDGIHEIARNRIAGQSYGEHANIAHAAMCDASLHHVTMQLCEIAGEEAHAESYVMGMFLDKGGETSRILSGRYIDRLEKRDGGWGIVLRRATVEVILEGTAAMLAAPAFAEQGYLKGDRDRTDLSYQRPLGLAEASRWGS